MSSDVTVSEPAFIRREDRRDYGAAGLDDVRVAADGVRAVDQIEDAVDPARVSRVDRVDDVDSRGVVDLLSAETAAPIGVAADRRDDMRAAGARHLHRIAANPAGRAHDHQQLPGTDAQQ